MEKNKDSRDELLKKIHQVLDKRSLEDLNNKEREYLKSLIKRLEYIDKLEEEAQQDADEEGKEELSLEPRVSIHRSKRYKEKTKSKSEKKEKEDLKEKLEKEDLFEIEKTETDIPEFAEVKPKKEEESEPIEEKREIEERKTGEIVENKELQKTEEKEEVEELEEAELVCYHCGYELDDKYTYCPKCGKELEFEEDEEKEVEEENLPEEVEWIEVEEEEDIDEKIKAAEGQGFDEYLIREDLEKEEGKMVEEKIKKANEKEKKIQSTAEKIFENLETVDEETSGLLYDNGIRSLNDLDEARIRDLTKIKGIRRKFAKKIKAELREKSDLVEEEKKKLEETKEEEDEWVTVEKESAEADVFTFDGYTLYEKEITTEEGEKRTVHFFSKKEQEDAKPIALPGGYEVKRNKKTGVPYLRKVR
ncbi:MAG: helix-hairpin-helix domain-containing protein [Candidatus Thermoplasmatota archaeon]